ncbi:DUF218 domain-containing protein [Propionicimonas paludicola]|uniref:DUF218 domain-containing protein n=1 Tax=Propionicimonas paludicola TaxID=185243 RepID=A0A2A9CSK0_9ACTN|nr:DUF218 domain-containing protein [Propionicimonas paludicola]
MVRAILLGMALALGVNALWLAAVANLSLGNFLAGALAVGLLVWAFVFADLPKLANGAIIGVLAAVLVSSGLLAWYGSSDNVDYHEDAVIVLGAAVHGTTVSSTLQARLDTALAYHQQNPKAWIVVTGGQGAQEDISEAKAAATYLLSRGVPDGQILRDELSTSTEENFAFAKRLLDSQLGSRYRIAFVTDDFHVFRAERTARSAGLVPTHLSCHSPWYFWSANYSRETVAALWSLLQPS